MSAAGPEAAEAALPKDLRPRAPGTVAIYWRLAGGLALFLVRGVAADDPPVDAVAIPKRIEDITREVAERVGTYPAEVLRWEAGRSVDVREETSLLGRGKGEAVRTLVRLIAPMAPHLAEESWARLGETGLVCSAAWPDHDPALPR